MGTLFVVGTPIGNLEDITLRAIRVLREVTLIAAEDTRHTRTLLAAHDISTQLVSFHEFSGTARVQRLVEQLSSGDVALVSDAGMPGLSDPGYPLIRAALEAGHEVVPIPGPSAILSALVASGLPMHAFTFHGFLPRKSGERRRLLASMAEATHSQIVFESPHRLVAALREIVEVLGPDRPVAVARELTKKFEEIVRGTAAEALARFERQAPRGEITIAIGPSEDRRTQRDRGRDRRRWNDAESSVADDDADGDPDDEDDSSASEREPRRG
ncbi:MAG: 16S rRNA (cytidine(1402)-2'-O)-methyltransferase [Chloroflexota bacterium]